MSAPPVSVAVSLSPTRRAWRRFRAHRLGFASLVLFVALFALLFAFAVSRGRIPTLTRAHTTRMSTPPATLSGDYLTQRA
jgi:microcin C transport system permease protein